MNSIKYQDENFRILRSTYDRVTRDTLCLFVTAEARPKMLSDAGFEVLGQAYIPPLEASLPSSKKKRIDPDSERSRKDLCVVIVTRAI